MSEREKEKGESVEQRPWNQRCAQRELTNLDN
jgi:hypothetical protein